MPTTTTINFYLDDGAILPTRAYPDDAGLDLYAPHHALIPAYESYIFDTGVHVQIPRGYAGILVSKSGLNINHNLTSTGLIDSSYTGSIRVKLYNNGPYTQRIDAGRKISQLVIVPFKKFEPKQVFKPLESDSRGDRGFGSSDKEVPK